MASAIGWIDFSSEHRKKVRMALDLMGKPAGILDELGIGPIRDAIADRLFPGVSTIQTRAKYFTLIPLLIRQYEQEVAGKASPPPLDDYLVKEERRCRARLVERHPEGTGNEETGIVGSTFGTDTTGGVARRPSSIYWNGLRKFGLIHPPNLSINEFGTRLVENRQSEQHYRSEGDIQDEEPTVYVEVPQIEETYWTELTITMTASEARFLRQKIIASQPESLLRRILESMTLIDTLTSVDKFTFQQFAEHPQLIQILQGLDPSLYQVVLMGAKFSKLMHGAHIRYNVQVQDRFGSAEKHEDMCNRWRIWRQELPEALSGWNTDTLWELLVSMGVRLQWRTERFVTTWIRECTEESNESVLDRLVVDQEINNKGRRARLHPQAHETVQDWVGLGELEYRLPNVRRLVQDLYSADPDGYTADA